MPPSKQMESPAKRVGPLRWLWRTSVHGCRWLIAPNAVGQPVTLQPRALRLLLFLAVGYALLVVLLGTALRQALTMPEPVRPQQLPTVDPAGIAQPTPTVTPTSTPAPTSGAIAFSLRRNGNTDIYALDQASHRLIRLTYHPAEDRSPAWSPDGQYLAFASNRAENWDIYLLDLMSGALIRLTHHESFDANPSWSPDGKSLAFETYRDGNLDVYVMSTSGERLRPLTSDPAPDFAPAWAPAGQALAFTSLRTGNKDIYLRLLDDGNQVLNITRSTDVDEDKPAWSSDGSRLAYVSGPKAWTSVRVSAFNWETLSTELADTEFFGVGDAPAWAPDGESLVYAHSQGGNSHLVAAQMTGWALFHEVYSTDGRVDDVAWTGSPISPRVMARADEASALDRADDPSVSFYAEVLQPTPEDGVPRRLMILPDVKVEQGSPLLSDEVNDSFNALRRRVREETGWDCLAELDSAWLPLNHSPPQGHSRRNWHLCGRAFALDQEPYGGEDPQIALVREEINNATYWRVFLRTAKQDGSLGEPLRALIWDLSARHKGGQAEVDGGAPREDMPSGYYVDFTAMAQDYGWDRVPSLWRWRHFWSDILWWEYRKLEGLTWWECMLKVFEPEEIESAFGPIPQGGE